MHNNINSICLCCVRKTFVLSKWKYQLVSIKSDQKLFGRIYIACQSRKRELSSFLAHENHLYPISFSKYGQLQQCKINWEILVYLHAVAPSLEPPGVDVRLFDGAAFVNMNPPRHFKTYGEYCDVELTENIKYSSKHW